MNDAKLLESFYARGAAPWSTTVKIFEEHGSIKLVIKTGNTDTTHYFTKATVEALGEALLRSLTEARVKDGDVTFYHRAGKAILPKLNPSVAEDESDGDVCSLDGEGCP